jgi:Flp pilus assembly protein protease CpaA
MKILLLVVISTICFFILWEDLKYRSVRVVNFLLLFFTAVLYSFTKNPSINEVITTGLINLLAVCILITLVIFFTSTFFSIPAFKLIGAGDIAFLISICTLFNPIENIVFLIFSCIFSLLIYFLLKYLKMLGNDADTIPLAGFQSFFLVPVLLLDHLTIFDLQHLYFQTA